MMPGNSSPRAVLVCYASALGSTAEIAEFIGAALRHSGMHVVLASVAGDPDPGLVDAVVLGSAIHDRAFLPEFTAYLDRRHDALASKPVWLFSVGMGPALRGPIGSVLGRMTPPAVRAVCDQLGVRGYHPLAGVFPRPRRASARIVMRALGSPFGDLRDWQAIAAWCDTLSGEIVATTQRPVT